MQDQKRTLRQNRSLHLWFSQIAEELNERGLDMKTVLKPEIEIPWTGESVKNHIYRPVMKILTGKESTTEQTTKDPTLVYETINRFLADKGIHIPLPSEESQSFKTIIDTSYDIL